MQKYKRPKDSPHVRLYFALLDSPAWRALPDSAKIILIECLREWRGRDDNSFKLPYETIKERLGLAPATISRDFLFLNELGFLDLKTPGGLLRRAAIYGLSDRWKGLKEEDCEAAVGRVKSKLARQRE